MSRSGGLGEMLKREKFGGRCFSEFGTTHRTVPFICLKNVREKMLVGSPAPGGCLKHVGFVPAGVMLQRLPKNGILEFRLAVVRIVLLEATGCVAVAMFLACS